MSNCSCHINPPRPSCESSFECECCSDIFSSLEDGLVMIDGMALCVSCGEQHDG